MLIKLKGNKRLIKAILYWITLNQTYRHTGNLHLTVINRKTYNIKSHLAVCGTHQKNMALTKGAMHEKDSIWYESTVSR